MNQGIVRGFTALGLLILLLLIWTRPYLRIVPWGDSIPLLMGLVFAYFLGRPWVSRGSADEVHVGKIAIGVCLLSVGFIGQSLTLLAIGWSLLLLSWILVYIEEPKPGVPWLLLVLLSFPWIAVDLGALGWWFRLSGAQVTEVFFGTLGFSIIREGTWINIQGMPVSVEPACAGMNLLPALLLAGTAVGLMVLGASRRFWCFFVLLPLLAWLANTLRILVITGVALTWGSPFASGFFHTWGALLVLASMFVGCILLAKLMHASPLSLTHE